MSKTLNLRDYPRDETGRIWTGESDSLTTSHDSLSHETSRDAELAPMHIRAMIWKFVALSNGAVSRAQIAKGIGRKKAGWIDRHIESLVQDHWLDRSQTTRPNGVVMFWYTARRP